MKHALLTVFSILCAATVAAQGLEAHLRVEPRRGAVAGWCDSAGHSITVKFDDPHPATDWDGGLITICTDSTSFSARTLPGVKLNGISLLLEANSDSTVLSLAGARDRQRFVLPGRIDLTSRPTTVATKCNVLRDDCKVIGPQVAPLRADAFTDMSALMAHLDKSTDPLEGLWQYYDHKTAALRASLGGRYTLATVSCPDSDAYYIIYIHGSENPDWRTLDVKGILTPTPLEGMYDLEWITDDRISVSHHSWAMVDSGILTLSFPHWDSSLRLVSFKNK